MLLASLSKQIGIKDASTKVEVPIHKDLYARIGETLTYLYSI